MNARLGIGKKGIWDSVFDKLFILVNMCLFMKIVAVHNRNFHADDVFAIAILRLVYPKVKVIRTRDEDKLKQADARVDVGLKYNADNLDFDHHQKGGAGERENGVPYASAGLIWKHYGKKLVSSQEIFEVIDKKIIQFIDANDSGLNTHEVKNISLYTVAEFIRGLNPPWSNQSEKLFDPYFEEAVSIVTKLLEREIESAEGVAKVRRILKEKISKNKKEYLLLDEFLPWKEVLVNESNLKFIVYHDPIEKHWVVRAIPVSLDSFTNRKDLPKAWAGLSNEELERVSGVKGAKFCHNMLFTALAYSKEASIKMVELALKND